MFTSLVKHSRLVKSAISINRTASMVSFLFCVLPSCSSFTGWHRNTWLKDVGISCIELWADYFRARLIYFFEPRSLNHTKSTFRINLHLWDVEVAAIFRTWYKVTRTILDLVLSGSHWDIRTTSISISEIECLVVVKAQSHSENLYYWFLLPTVLYFMVSLF